MNIMSQLSRRLDRVRNTDRSSTIVRAAVALLVSVAFLPGVTWAGQQPENHNPHLSEGSPDNQVVRSLRIEFRTPPRMFAGDARSCGDRCFALSPGGLNEYQKLQSTFGTRDTSLNLGQSGPVSLRFTGSRLKMQVEF